jgi:hypothetical protein
MNTSAQITANLRSAERLAHVQTGTSGIEDSDLSYEQRIYYNKALASIIAKYPERFNTTINKTAQVIVKKVYPPLEMPMNPVVSFANEFAKQATSLNDTFNPFAIANRNVTKWLLIASVITVAGFYFGPMLLKQGRAFRETAR